ncbi:hypothetical protein D3C78_1478570 [compost metagenome]
MLMSNGRTSSPLDKASPLIRLSPMAMPWPAMQAACAQWASENRMPLSALTAEAPAAVNQMRQSE